MRPVLIFLILLWGNLLHAQTPLDIRECYRISKAYSERVSISEEDIAAAQAYYKQALAEVLPLISFRASEFLQDSSTDFADDNVGQTFTQFSRPEIKFNAKQSLFRGLREITRIKLAKTNIQKTRFDYQDVERLLFQDVATSFYTIALIEKDIETTRKIIGVVEQRIIELKVRINLGKSREGELTQEESLHALLEADLQRKLGQKTVAYQMMSFLTGLDPMPPIAWQDPIPSEQKSLDYYLGQVENRPDLKAAKQEILIKKDEVKIARGEFLPTIDAETNVYALRSGFQQGILWDAEFRFEVPVFNYANFGKLDEAKVREKQSEMRTENIRRIAVDQIKKSNDELQSSLEQLRKYREAVSLAFRNFQLQNEDFKIGRANNLDVLTAQRTWLESLEQRNRSEIQSWLDWTNLQIASGVFP